MTWLLVAAWLGLGLLGWWFMEEGTLIQFGKVTLDDRLFFVSLVLVGPGALIVGVLIRVVARGVDRVVRTRK